MTGCQFPREMNEIARETGIPREALYKALREDSSPRLDTIAVSQGSESNIPELLTLQNTTLI